MGRGGIIHLPPTVPRARLHVRLYVPRDAFSESPVVAFAINGKEIDRIAASESIIDRTWETTLRADGPSQLAIETDHVLNPRRAGMSADSRDLGARLDALDLGSLCTSSARGADRDCGSRPPPRGGGDAGHR